MCNYNTMAIFLSHFPFTPFQSCMAVAVCQVSSCVDSKVCTTLWNKVVKVAFHINLLTITHHNYLNFPLAFLFLQSSSIGFADMIGDCFLWTDRMLLKVSSHSSDEYDCSILALNTSYIKKRCFHCIGLGVKWRKGYVNASSFLL